MVPRKRTSNGMKFWWTIIRVCRVSKCTWTNMGNCTTSKTNKRNIANLKIRDLVTGKNSQGNCWAPNRAMAGESTITKVTIVLAVTIIVQSLACTITMGSLSPTIKIPQLSLL